MAAHTNLAHLASVASMYLCICTLAACGRPPPTEVSGCDAIVETYLSQRTIQDFASQGVETQYQIFVCARIYVRPPMVEIDREFALQGEPAARFLIDKITETDDDRIAYAILNVFDKMSDLETYDVAGDVSLMELLRTKTSAMTNVPRRRLSEQLLRDIEQRRAS